MKRLLWLAFWAGLCWQGAAAHGEVFLLTNGGRIEGELLNHGESPRKTYIVQPPLGGQVTLAASQVSRHFQIKDAERQYEQEALKSPDTAAGHLAMAEWCRVNDLLSKRKFHLEKVLERDADNEVARRALGYSGKVSGRWLKQDELMKSQGYVRYQGAWKVRQEAEADMAAKKFEQDVVAWKKKLRVLRNRVEKRGDADAWNEIKAAREPAAGVAFADLLANEEFRDQRLFYIEMLGEIPTPAGVKALIRHALHDDDETVRDACLAVLGKQAKPQAVSVFTSTLAREKNDNRLINRAAAGLGRLGDDACVPLLIDTLVTVHKTVSGGSSGGGGLGQLTPSFNSGGGGGLSVGGKPKVTIHNVPNDSVLAALRAITKENFQFDKEAWRAWYVESHTPQNVNLRRRDDS